MRIKFGMRVVPLGVPQNSTVEYPKKDSNKITEAEVCEMGPTVSVIWWQNSKPCPKIKKMA
jgi:hypothetical protein